MSSFVRSLTNAEGNHVQRILRHGKSRTPFRRAQVIIHSAHGYTVQQIAQVTCLHEEYIRELIRRFNREGLELFKERARSGRPVEFIPEVRADIVKIALSPPKLLGCPFTRWSVPKLLEHILKVNVVRRMSDEKLRQILKEEGVHLQRTKTWKDSKDPAFRTKKKRIDRLRKRVPPKSHLLAFDQLGPIELRPIHGRTWAQKSHPDRLPATYTRPHGTRQWLAFLDIKKDKLWGYFSPRKRWQEVLRAFKWMRSRYPIKERLYVILDNFSPHLRPEIRQWARKNNVSLVYTPTNASWMNPIECEFTEPKDYVLTNSYYKSHNEMQQAWIDFLRYRNKRNSQHKNS